MLQIHSDLQELLAGLNNTEQSLNIDSYQNAYLRFRSLVVAAVKHRKVYEHWAQQYLVDVSDESGEVVKLHESAAYLISDIQAFITLIERNQ